MAAAAGGGMMVVGGVVVAAMTGATMCMVIVIAEQQVVRWRIPAAADMAAAEVVMRAEEEGVKPHDLATKNYLINLHL